MMNHWDAELFAALVCAAEQRLCKFSAQDIANTAWAFVTMIRWDEKIVAALVYASEQRLCEFNA